MSDDGWVSIWLFQKSGIEAEDVLRDIFSIDNYDIDFQDVVGEEDWKLLPVSELIARLSYSESFKESAIAAAETRRIGNGRRALAQYDFKYQPADAPPPSLDDPMFLGTFQYHL